MVLAYLALTVVVLSTLVAPRLEKLVVEPEELEDALAHDREDAVVLWMITEGGHWAQAGHVAQPQHREHLPEVTTTDLQAYVGQIHSEIAWV